MELQAQKQALLERRKALILHLVGLESTLEETPNKDGEERAVERQSDEVMEALGKVELAEISQIDAALARIEDGTYGLCARCGDPIAESRLRLVPAVPLCRECAR